MAAGAQAGAAITYQATRPIPPPPPWTLTVRVLGEGEGTVQLSLAGDNKVLGRCSKADGKCRFDVPRDVHIGAVALRGEKMTFEGWDGCAPYQEDVLACEVRMFTDRELSCDHIVPTSRGGRNTWVNVVAACKRCNHFKQNRTPEEAGMELLALPFEPNPAEYLALMNSKRIRADQMDFLKAQFSRNCRIYIN